MNQPIVVDSSRISPVPVVYLVDHRGLTSSENMTHTATTASSPVVSAPPTDQNTVNQSITVSYWNENDRPRYTVVETKTKGRGKVVVVGEAGVDPGRHHQGEKRVHEGVHRIAAVSELDARHGELPSDPPARVDARLAYGYVMVSCRPQCLAEEVGWRTTLTHSFAVCFYL